MRPVRAVAVAFAGLGGALALVMIGGAPACVVQTPSLDAAVDVGLEAAVVQCDLSGDCDSCQACVVALGSCTDELQQCSEGPACDALATCLHDCNNPGAGGAGGAGGASGAGGADIDGCKAACCTAHPNGVNAYEVAQACAYGYSCPISCVGRTYHCP